MNFINLTADIKRKSLRDNILKEAITAINAGDDTQFDALIKKATNEWFLDAANWIRGQKAYSKKDFPKALEYFEMALKLDPSFAPAHHSKVAVLIEMGSLEEAIKSADYVISHLMLIQFAPYFYNKGIALDRLNRSEEALYCFFRAIEDDEHFIAAYMAIISSFARTEEWSKLFSTLPFMKEKLKDKPLLLDGLASVLLQLTEKVFKDGNMNLAISLLEEVGNILKIAIEKAPESTSILYNLACFYSRSGNKPEALSNLKKAIDLASESEKRRIKELSRNDVDFVNIREDSTFKDLVLSP
jgi:tetratricopeptide (TPR) repeat protein